MPNRGPCDLCHKRRAGGASPPSGASLLMERGELRRGLGPGGDEPAGVLRVQRAGEEVALAEFAAQLLQEEELRAGLDPFGVDVLAQGLAQLEDGLDDL